MVALSLENEPDGHPKHDVDAGTLLNRPGAQRVHETEPLVLLMVPGEPAQVEVHTWASLY